MGEDGLAFSGEAGGGSTEASYKGTGLRAVFRALFDSIKGAGLVAMSVCERVKGMGEGEAVAYTEARSVDKAAEAAKELASEGLRLLELWALLVLSRFVA